MLKPRSVSPRNGAFSAYTSFLLNSLNNLSAISTASLVGSLDCPMSFNANTKAESLIKSMSGIS